MKKQLSFLICAYSGQLIAIFLVLLTTSACFAKSASFYGDLLFKSFRENSETCQHLLGELNGDGSPEDRIVISNANWACEKAKKQQAILLKRYVGNKEALEAIRNDELLPP